ncbi:hypothetical protein O7635_05385 [Asanoa sp. WMMD1127]|uniref:hypothetical protein n=1 Tax=Asanoa sp. WMMD1127 TaxID=3016107 RepID=UPI0024172189|nr:hypothetical protein [Asanoa sp. WMMD1127]MDG4821285.1 hypothetical protein [Asanoa sp. WMMD1127]
MPQTASGIVYPTSADNVDPPGDMQAMANSLEVIVSALLTPPAVRAYNNAGLSMANNTLTVIPLQAESSGMKTVASMHSTSSNTSRLVAPENGVYTLSAMISYAANATGRRVCQVRKNAAGSGLGGTQLHSVNIGPGPTSGTVVTFSDDIALSANDYVEMFGYQLSGGALSVDAGEFNTAMSLHLVRYT